MRYGNTVHYVLLYFLNYDWVYYTKIKYFRCTKEITWGSSVQCRNTFVPDSFGRLNFFVCYLNLHENIITKILRPFLDPARSYHFWHEHFTEKIIKKLKKIKQKFAHWVYFHSISDVLHELRASYDHFNHTTCFWSSTFNPFLREHFCIEDHCVTGFSPIQTPGTWLFEPFSFI